jgi:hypothetical protein
MANTYDVGDSVRISGSFAVLGTATDPTTVALKIKPPTGSIVAYDYSQAEITRSALGKFYKDVIVDQSGKYYYRWEGTGQCTAAEEGSFLVRSQKVK